MTRRTRWTTAIVGTAVAVTSLLGGIHAANRELEPMTAADARAFTARALREAGADAEVGRRIRRATFTAESGDEIDVWIVPAAVDGQLVELYVRRDGAEAVNLDDEIVPGRHVLSPAQFAALDRFRFDPVAARERQRQRRPAVIAGGLVIMAGGAATWVARRTRRQAGSSSPK